MKNLSPASLCLMVLIAAAANVLLREAGTAGAASCSLTELTPCLSVISTSDPPSEECCAKVKEQQSCFCTYLKDPTLQPYVHSSGVQHVISGCNLAVPTC